MNKFKIKDNVTQIIHLKRQIKKVFNTIFELKLLLKIQIHQEMACLLVFLQINE
jgi:hypothetical protein